MYRNDLGRTRISTNIADILVAIQNETNTVHDVIYPLGGDFGQLVLTFRWDECVSSHRLREGHGACRLQTVRCRKDDPFR
jgi:hypothetical protein